MGGSSVFHEEFDNLGQLQEKAYQRKLPKPGQEAPCRYSLVYWLRALVGEAWSLTSSDEVAFGPGGAVLALDVQGQMIWYTNNLSRTIYECTWILLSLLPSFHIVNIVTNIIVYIYGIWYTISILTPFLKKIDSYFLSDSIDTSAQRCKFPVWSLRGFNTTTKSMQKVIKLKIRTTKKVITIYISILFFDSLLND